MLSCLVWYTLVALNFLTELRFLSALFLTLQFYIFFRSNFKYFEVVYMIPFLKYSVFASIHMRPLSDPCLSDKSDALIGLSVLCDLD